VGSNALNSGSFRCSYEAMGDLLLVSPCMAGFSQEDIPSRAWSCKQTVLRGPVALLLPGFVTGSRTMPRMRQAAGTSEGARAPPPSLTAYCREGETILFVFEALQARF